MNLAFSEEDSAFRLEIREFLKENVSADLQTRVRAGVTLAKEERVAWYRRLNARGWMAPGWPKKYGGADWSPIRRMIFDEEVTAYGAPPVAAQGISMLAPILIAFGSDEQRRHYLPRILNSDDWWCQGYSEPGSGSDLASLRTRAIRDGDHFLVNGQKTWITQAHIADMMFCLVRTEIAEKKHDGISFMLIDMRSPGVTVRPIQTLNNHAEICEVFLEDVRVHVDNLVGEAGQGWSYATYLLEHERVAVGNVAHAREHLLRIKSRPLSASLAERVARLEMRLTAAAFTQLRSVAAATAGGRSGPESSLLKIIGTELMQEIAFVAMRSAGPDALARDSMETAAYFDSRKLSIFSGSNEIQRNIIAKRVLGL